MRIRGGASEPQTWPTPAITNAGTAAVIAAFNPPVELADRVALMLAQFKAAAVGFSAVVAPGVSTQPRRMMRGLAPDLRHVIVVGLCGAERRQRLGYFVKGTADGLRGRTGRSQDTR